MAQNVFNPQEFAKFLTEGKARNTQQEGGQQPLTSTNINAQAFADFLFQGKPRPQAAPPKGGSIVGDSARGLLGGAVQGTGMAVEGLGNLATSLDDYFQTGGPNSVGSMTEALGQWINEKGQGILAGRSQQTQEAIANSQISGTLWKPSTWDFGQDPTLRGLGGQLTEVLGQIAPIIVASVTSGGFAAAGVGGLQAGQGGRDQAEGLVQDAFDRGVLQQTSQRYQELIQEGKSPQDALAAVKEEAQDLSQLLTMPVGALGGYATGKIFEGAVQGGSRNLARRLITSGVVGAVEEGTQEVAEGMAAKAGVQLSTDVNQNYGEGTFGDFVLGAMAGGPVGVVGGIRRVEPAEVPDITDLGDLGDDVLGTDPGTPGAPTSPTNTLQKPVITTQLPVPVDGGATNVSTPSTTINQQEIIQKAVQVALEKSSPDFRIDANIEDIDFIDVDLEPLVDKEVEATKTAIQGPFEINGYSFVSGKTGSSEGGIYKSNTTGVEYIMKKYNDPLQVDEEVLANNIVTNMGFQRNIQPIMYTSYTTEGNKVLRSKMLNGFKPFDSNNPDHIKAAQKHMMVNAWLANWDVFGLDWDNVLVAKNSEGTPTLSYVDLGGTLDFRAKEGLKGLKFGNTVSELDTFLDMMINPKTASIYKDVPIREMRDQVDNIIIRFGDGTLLDALIGSQISNFVKGEELKNKLLHRLKDMARRVESVLIDQIATPNKAVKIKISSTQQPTEISYFEQVTNHTPIIKKLEEEANIYKHYNEHVVIDYTAQGNNMVATILADPKLLNLTVDANFDKWIKGNKIWWNAKTNKLMFKSFDPSISMFDIYMQYNLLPPILFHGTQTKQNIVWDDAKRMYLPFPEFDKKKSGDGSGGGDTYLGMFFEADPYIASTYAAYDFSKKSNVSLKKLSSSKVFPFVVNLNPFVVNVKNNWSPKITEEGAAKAKALGYNSAIFFNIHDKGGIGTQVIVFDPDQSTVKSPFSKAFDPNVKDYKASYAGTSTTWTSLPAHEITALKKELAKFGLDKLLELKFFTQDKFPGVAARFGKDARSFYIALSESLPSSMSHLGQLRHEIIHALKHFGFFDSVEGQKMWKVLEKEAAKRGIPDWIKDNYNRNDWVEESIAVMMDEWTDGKFKPEGFLETTFKRIRDFFTALGNWARGLGFTTAEGVFDYLVSGNPKTRAWLSDNQSRVMDGFERDIAYSILAAKKLGIAKPNTAKADYYGRLVKHGWTVIQLAKKNLHISWLQEYVQYASQWHAAKMKWMSHANTTVGKWNNLSFSQQEALAKVLFDVEQMIYRSPQEVQKGVVRKPTKQELVGLFKHHNLGQAGVQVYIQVRADFDAMLNKIEQVTLDSIAKTLANNTLAMQLEQVKAKAEFDAMRLAPYFPHARFGTYTIVVKDSAGKVAYVETFQREKSRDAAMKGVLSKFPASKGFVVAKSKLSEEAKLYTGIPQALLLQMKSNLTLSSQQMAALEEMIVHAMPAMSFKNHFVRKENIAGYSKDALRAYADYFWHGANHIARIEFGPLMEGSILNGEQNIKGMINAGMDSTKRVKILDFLRSHYDNIMNPNEDWASLRSIGFLWWLGFNVKSALLNFTQVPLVSYSHLASHFGDRSSTVELTKAMTQLRQMFRAPNKAMSATQIADLELIARGIENGFLDESFASELAGLAEGSNLTQGIAKTKVRKMLLQFNQAAGYLFQTTEKINRRVTFMAAVNLARKNPNSKYLAQVQQRFNLEYTEMIKEGMLPSEALAFLAGKDSVESTQFNYSAWARPRFMRGRANVLFTFFMFTQNMLWFIQNSPGNTRYLLLLLLFAGISGMPGYEDLEEMVKGIGAKVFGKEWNMEKELREILIEVMGEDGPPPDLFLNGISRYGFGLAHLADMVGVPFPQIDMSGNIGMGSPLPIISPAIQGISAGLQGKDFDEVLGEFTQEGIGATLGIGVGLVKAMADTRMQFTDPKRWESAMPAAMQGLSKAARYYTEGVERTRTGGTIMEFDKNNPYHMAEIIAQALAFRPTRTAQTWDKIIMQREAEKFWTTRRSLLLRQFDWALMNESPEDEKEVRDAINRFNQTLPQGYEGLKISRSTLRRSRQGRENSRERIEAGLPQSNMMKPVFEDVDKLHPEVTSERLPSGQ